MFIRSLSIQHSNSLNTTERPPVDSESTIYDGDSTLDTTPAGSLLLFAKRKRACRQIRLLKSPCDVMGQVVGSSQISPEKAHVPIDNALYKNLPLSRT